MALALSRDMADMGKRAAEASSSAPSPKRAAAVDTTPAGSVSWSSAGDSLESTRQSLRTFAKAREWDQASLTRVGYGDFRTCH